MCMYVGVGQTGKYEQHIFLLSLNLKKKKQSCNTKRNEISILNANYIGMKNYTGSGVNHRAYIS